MSNTTEELNRIIEKLCGIPTDRKHWDSTIKAQIFYELRESIQDLLKLKRRLEYINYTPKQFYELSAKEGIEIVWFKSKNKKLTPEKVSFDEFKKYYLDCEDCSCDFDGEFLKLKIYWSEEDLMSSIFYSFGINVSDV